MAPKPLKNDEKTVTVHIKVPESIHAEFFAQCEELDTKGSTILRRLLKNWLDENKARKVVPTERNVKAKATKGGKHE